MARVPADNRAVITVDKAWEILFEKHGIVSKVLTDGCFRIKASEINTVKEARLMAKFDRSAQLPSVFQSNNVSILPISRGEYIIGPFETHKKIAYPKCQPTPVTIPNLETIDHANLYSEASALLFAYNSGIIKDAVNTAGEIYYTVSGRMSSGCFDYVINRKDGKNKTHRIFVENSQIEIDAGYEFANGFCVVEAKNIAVEEIPIRQLYYPYRLWKSKISKPVLPVLMVFSNDVFHFFHYRFEDVNHYNSLTLVSYQAYTFASEPISLDEIIEIWKSIKMCTEPPVTFPQADLFARVIDLLSVLFERGLTREEVTVKYEFDPRQTNYYISACDYLGLIKRVSAVNDEREYQLSAEARHILSLQYKQKNLSLVRKILERPVFHNVFGYIVKSSTIPSKGIVCDLMNKAALPINATTIGRRSSTVLSWVDWILRLTHDEL